MKKVAGSLRVDLAQFRALEAFAMFASDLDAASRQQLARGARLVELLKQPQYSPYPMEEQVVSVWAGTSGEIDTVPVEDIMRFERELLDHLRRNTGILDSIRESGQFTDETEASLKAAVTEFKRGFQTGSGTPLAGVGREESEPLEEAEVEQEKIVRQKRG
jgi:F-type H+-transporting ATPase subunit alpha